MTMQIGELNKGGTGIRPRPECQVGQKVGTSDMGKSNWVKKFAPRRYKK